MHCAGPKPFSEGAGDVTQYRNTISSSMAVTTPVTDALAEMYFHPLQPLGRLTYLEACCSAAPKH
eukprot:1043630-Amphidinium_carterae.1